MPFEITTFRQKMSFDKKISLVGLLDQLGMNDKRYICAKVNNRVRELSYEIYYDAEVEFLDLTYHESVKIYESCLRYICAMAFKRCYPKLNVKFSYNVSRCVLIQLLDDGYTPNMAMLLKIKHEMESIIAADLPFNRVVVTNDKARKIYKKLGYHDKEDILNYRQEKTVHLYECDGYLNYNYQVMVPSTGYIKDFRLRLYSPGFLMQYPRSECGGKIPDFRDASTFSRVLQEGHAWQSTVGLSSVAAINKRIEEAGAIELINVGEARHYRQLTELGQLIEDDIDQIRLICIAGPSSSGKTTFANRLRIELLARGINTVRISLDDYYKPREESPRLEDGSLDFESIEALDIDQFNSDMFDLIAGKEVTLPHFDFVLGHSVPGRVLKIGKNEPIIIEGIHALNELMTSAIPKQNKFKIFIAPVAQINIDNHNPVSLTDLRLIRRIVRDKKFRGSSAEETLSMWPGVRQGEFKWIYETQEDSDYVFNSFLPYELPIMKKVAQPMLEAIDKESPYSPDARRLLKMLKFFVDIPDEWIPNNSIIREFIGGSCFSDV